MEALAAIQFLFLSFCWLVICSVGLYITLVYVAPKIHDYFLFKKGNQKND